MLPEHRERRCLRSPKGDVGTRRSRPPDGISVPHPPILSVSSILKVEVWWMGGKGRPAGRRLAAVKHRQRSMSRPLLPLAGSTPALCVQISKASISLTNPIKPQLPFSLSFCFLFSGFFFALLFCLPARTSRRLGTRRTVLTTPAAKDTLTGSLQSALRATNGGAMALDSKRPI